MGDERENVNREAVAVAAREPRIPAAMSTEGQVSPQEQEVPLRRPTLARPWAAESAPAASPSTRSIVKAAFRSPGTKYYGALVLILPDDADSIPALYQIIGKKREYDSLTPTLGWQELATRILAAREKEGVSPNAMAALELALPAENGIAGLRRAAGQGGEALRQILGTLLARVLGDRLCEFDVAAERAGREALAGAGPGAPPPTEALLHIQLLVDPLNGLPAHRLHPGTKLAVYLLHEEAADGLLIDRFQPRDERGKPLPVTATIVSVASREDETLEFVVAIGDRVKGRAVIRKALKLRVCEEILPGPGAADRAESAPAPAGAAAPGQPREILLLIFALEIVFFLFLFLIVLVSYWR